MGDKSMVGVLQVARGGAGLSSVTMIWVASQLVAYHTSQRMCGESLHRARASSPLHLPLSPAYRFVDLPGFSPLT